MGDPHNPKRAGELWNQERIEVQLVEIAKIKDLIVLSGGWAWHFMSIPGHKEVKTHHDMKDVDIFVKPEEFETLRQKFIELGYQRQHTQWDNPSGKFYRFTKYYDGGKIVFDVFLEDIPYVDVNTYKVVDPIKLVSLYGIKHSSEQCLAVQAARLLITKGINPIGRPELTNEQDGKA